MKRQMELKIKKLHEDAVTPKYATIGDAGLDLYSVDNYSVNPGETILVKTGIAIELPYQTEGQVRPKSGLALKHGITVLNTPGTIDEGYRGEVGIVIINHGKKTFIVEKGSKIAQLVVKPVWYVNVVEVNELSEAERGVGGFGSTGLK